MPFLRQKKISSTNLPQVLEVGGTMVALVMVCYHFISTRYLFFDIQQHQNIHLIFAFTLVILVSLKEKYHLTLYLISLGVLVSGLCSMVYVHLNVVDLEMRIGYLEIPDIILGSFLVLAVIDACRRAWGMIFPTLAAIGILYAFFGHYIPEPLGHKLISPELVLSYLGIGMQGVYGPLLYASANLIFPFVVFAALLKSLGGVSFFSEVGKIGGMVFRGGPAQTAVVSSALVGMCTGAAAANVAITGSFTIPHMKKEGYRPETAAGIEATASTGGQIMPPVMGASAFIMAGFLGVPYMDIMKAALVPAVLFFVSVGFGIQMRALRLGLKTTMDPIDFKLMAQTSLVFVVPLGVLISLLMLRFSPKLSAFWSTLCLLVLSMVQQITRPSLKTLMAALKEGAEVGAAIGIGCACIGFFSQILTFTGLGIKIAGLVEILSGGNLAIASILSALLAILLGCGLPTLAAYSIAATVVAPVLVDMGVAPLAAHMFVFYFSVFAAITPPVAGACMVGCRLADSSYLRTCAEALKLSVAAYILPFVMLTTPIVFLNTVNPMTESIEFICAVAAIGAFVCVSQKYFLTPINLLEQTILLSAGALLLAYPLTGNLTALIIGVFELAVLLLSQVYKLSKSVSLKTGRVLQGKIES